MRSKERQAAADDRTSGGQFRPSRWGQIRPPPRVPAAGAARPPSLTAASTSASIPSRRPSATASTMPALTATRSSSKTTPDRSDRACTHAGDLLSQAAAARHSRSSPCSGGHLTSRAGQITAARRWIEADATVRTMMGEAGFGPATSRVSSKATFGRSAHVRSAAATRVLGHDTPDEPTPAAPAWPAGVPVTSQQSAC